MTKIASVETYMISVPRPQPVWTAHEESKAWNVILTEVRTDDGLVGYGEIHGAPMPRICQWVSRLGEIVRGAEALANVAVWEKLFALTSPRPGGIEGLDGLPPPVPRGERAQVMAAIAGIDIALWDIAAKVEGVPLHQLIGNAKRKKIPAYASLLRIGNETHIAGECEAARRAGYGAIKLHEITVPAVSAARHAIGDGVPLMVDMNCPLSGVEAIAFAKACQPAQPMFLEEPVWPPEDFATLAEVRAKGGLDIAAGENACTSYQFHQMMTAGAVSHAQPSVIKVGGITEFLKVAAIADALGVRIVPHSPYFGPGFLATLQLLSLRGDGFIEVFYMKRDACLWRGGVDVDASGHIDVPTGMGLGFEPDKAVMERYRVS